MALFDSVLAPVGASTTTQATRTDQTGTVNSGASSAEIAMGAYQYFAFNASGDVNLRFGGVGLPAATAADFRIPSGVTVVYPVTKQNPSFRIFNAGGSTITWWLQPLSSAL
jgi:hypothetical protein